MIVGRPVIAHGNEEAAAGSITAKAVSSWHDDVQGAKRGPNTIRIFEIDGMKIVHMGDQGCMPDGAAMQAIEHADIMMIPVGGTYTVDAQEAKAIIELAKPRCIIPMHVKTKRCPYPIEKVQRFLELMNAADRKPVDVLDVTRDCVPCGVVLMNPMADEL